MPASDNKFDVNDVDDARGAWRSGERQLVRSCGLTSLSLGAAIEAACWHSLGSTDEKELLHLWMPTSLVMQRAASALAGGALPVIEHDHASPELEVRRAPVALELSHETYGTEWAYYLDRFRRSLVERLGMERRRAQSVCAAFGEMADNVVQHAQLSSSHGAVVAYAVSPASFEFAVGDIGRGVLASLRDNPRNSGITNETDALLAAVEHGASRRSGVPGSGFAELARALADIQSELSFRSGDGRLEIDGRGTGDRRVRAMNCPKLQGFCVSVIGKHASNAW